jgi:hypothetical protein
MSFQLIVTLFGCLAISFWYFWDRGFWVVAGYSLDEPLPAELRV